MRSGSRRLPPWTSPRGTGAPRWSPCTPGEEAILGRPTPASCCSRPPRPPLGESPYVRAKQAQLVEKDPNKAVPLFWAAINSGDRIESALKDMATVLKQANRAEEAIEAIRSFRDRCPNEAQESIDNVLLDLYKKCGRTDEQIEMLKNKLRMIDEELASGRWKTKLSRSQGRRIYVSLKDEKSRLLGNLAWAFMQSDNYEEAEMLYRQALAVEADYNKECNLAICLMKTGRVKEAKYILEAVPSSSSDGECHAKSLARATRMLLQLQSEALPSPITQMKHKEPSVLLAAAAADAEIPQDSDPQRLPSPITQMKSQEPEKHGSFKSQTLPSPITQCPKQEKHGDFESKTLPSPITQMKRREVQILVAEDGEKHEDVKDEYPDFRRLFNDAATPQSVLEKLRQLLIKDDAPKLAGADRLPNASSNAAASKSWADMVEEDEQELDHDNLKIGTRNTTEEKYRTPAFSDESNVPKGLITCRWPPSSSSSSWRRNDCKEEEQQLGHGNSRIGTRNTTEEKYRTPTFSDESKVPKGLGTRRWPPSSSSSSWRRNDCEEEEQQHLDHGNSNIGTRNMTEEKYRTPSFSDESKPPKGPFTRRWPPCSSSSSWRRNDCEVSRDENVNWKQQNWQDHRHRVYLNERPQDFAKGPKKGSSAQRSLFSDHRHGLVPFGGTEHSRDSGHSDAVRRWPSHVASSEQWRPQHRLRVFREITNDINQNLE